MHNWQHHYTVAERFLEFAGDWNIPEERRQMFAMMGQGHALLATIRHEES